MLTSDQDNFIKMFERSFKEHWDLPAVTDYGTPNTFTYAQLAERVAMLHLVFQTCGIKKDDKIAIMGKNNCNWVASYIATVTFGAIVVPILQDFKANDALHIVNHSDAQILFVTDSIWECLEMQDMKKVKVVFSLNDFRPLASRLNRVNLSQEAIQKMFKKVYPKGFKKEDVHYDDRPNTEVASINYTSGTTGFSKGVITPCNALAGNIISFYKTGGLFEGCRHVAFLPLAHAYGCGIDFLGVIVYGGHTYFIGRTPAPKILLQAFAEVKPTNVLTVPLIVEKIYKKQIVPQISKTPVRWALKIPFLSEAVLGKVRQQLIDAFGGQFEEVIIGGAPLNAEVEEFLTRIKFPYAVGYGMTECAPLISFTPYKDGYKPLSCGKILDDMEIKVVNPDEQGVGELWVRGEHVMLGYYKNAAATREILTKDGWLKTGDLGYIDEEGFIFIKGRNKTMLLGPSGQNIYPEEIEAKLNNMPYVMESLVIQHEDHLVALVCPDYEVAGQMTSAEIETAMEENRKALNNELAAYEQITKIKLYPHEFEKTPKKSIKRFLYTAMATD